LGGGGIEGATTHRWHVLLHFLDVLGTLHCPFCCFFLHLDFLNLSRQVESPPRRVPGGYGGNPGAIGGGGGPGLIRAMFQHLWWSDWH